MGDIKKKQERQKKKNRRKQERDHNKERNRRKRWKAKQDRMKKRQGDDYSPSKFRSTKEKVGLKKHAKRYTRRVRRMTNPKKM